MNQYTAVGGITPTYDARGNITWYPYITAGYDCENRLVSAGTITYGYDLLGRRTRRSAQSLATMVYIWDGAHIIAEYMSGYLVTKYVYGPGIDNPVAMICVNSQTQAETWYYYYADAIGSVRLMTNAAGTPVESYTYDVYGRPRMMQAAGADGNWLTEDVSTQNYSMIGNPIMFTGRWWHSRTGLYYYRFRDYDPVLGRFLQCDPAGYIDAMNLYAYCGNNPVNWIDSFGLTPLPPYITPTGFDEDLYEKMETHSTRPAFIDKLRQAVFSFFGFGFVNPIVTPVSNPNQNHRLDELEEQQKQLQEKQLQFEEMLNPNVDPYTLESIADHASEEWIEEDCRDRIPVRACPRQGLHDQAVPACLFSLSGPPDRNPPTATL